jgi:hypothetical protein
MYYGKITMIKKRLFSENVVVIALALAICEQEISGPRGNCQGNETRVPDTGRTSLSDYLVKPSQ